MCLVQNVAEGLIECPGNSKLSKVLCIDSPGLEGRIQEYLCFGHLR